MTEAVETVLLDIDDTICEYRRSGDEVLTVAFERVGVDPFFTRADYVARYDDFVEESEDMRDLRRRCFEAVCRDTGWDPALGRDVARAYAGERDHADVRFLEGAREALSHLSEDYRLGAVTNGSPEMQTEKLAGLGVDCFETVVHGGYDAPAKPAAEPFHLALDRLGVGPGQAVKVGNSLQHDVAGAHRAGVRSVWLDRNGTADPDPEPHYVLESMADLTDPPWE